jgi:hypothetical protein
VYASTRIDVSPLSIECFYSVALFDAPRASREP